MRQVVDGADWFRIATQSDGLTLIQEPWAKPFYNCNMWHIRGRDRDLLLDTGLGVFSLRKHVPLTTERPLIAVASHSHFDHVGGHHEFGDRAIHAAEADILAHPDAYRTLITDFCSDDIFERFPVGWEATTYSIRAAPATRILVHGDIIDLGDRSFEVIHVPGHSPGGIALWEKKTGILFSGDTVMDGPLYDSLFHSNVPDYIASMERLRTLEVSVVHAGHFGSFGRARFLDVIDDYLLGRRKPGCPAA